MTACYWYAVIGVTAGRGVALAAWGPGLRDRPLRLVAEGALGGVVSDWQEPALPRMPAEVDLALVWQHEQVVERIMAATPLLPVRFGTLLAGDERVQRVLAERQHSFLADLNRVAGCVEMGVRVLWDPPEQAPTVLHAEPRSAETPGAQYLFRRLAGEQARRAAEAEGRELATQIDLALQALAVGGQPTVLATDRLLLSGAYLVRRPAVEAFRVGVEGLRKAYPRLAFLCSGPWPPYHFVRS